MKFEMKLILLTIMYFKTCTDICCQKGLFTVEMFYTTTCIKQFSRQNFPNSFLKCFLSAILYWDILLNVPFGALEKKENNIIVYIYIYIFFVLFTIVYIKCINLQYNI